MPVTAGFRPRKGADIWVSHRKGKGPAVSFGPFWEAGLLFLCGLTSPVSKVRSRDGQSPFKSSQSSL